VSHIDIPQSDALIAVLYQFAEKYRIQAIPNGRNIATECVKTPSRYICWGTNMSQIRDVIRRFVAVEMNIYPFSSVYRHKMYLRYLRGVKVFKLRNFNPYTKTGARDELVRAYGWKPYPLKHFESRFTRVNGGYRLSTRFGFDLQRVQFSA